MKTRTRDLFATWRPELIGLVLAAFATRLWDVFNPKAVVFDEVYFKAFAAHYLDHHYFFDIHPPLGKLLLASEAHLLGLTPATMLNGTPVAMRLLPAIAGALIIPVVWAILRRLGASRAFAFLGAATVLLDNAITVESRFILMDSMLMLTGLAAVYFYLVARDHTSKWHWAWLAAAALAAGASVSIKWTGLNALAIILLVWAWDQRGRTIGLGKRAGELALLVIIPVTLYVSVFAIHFALLTHSGDGDAFMTPKFQATLVGSNYYNPHAHDSFISRFLELNKEMYVANQTLTATHPYSSRWYTWPLELRGVYYWQGPVMANGSQGNIYLLGNPIVWWGVWVAILCGASFAWVQGVRLRPATIAALAIAASAYFINLLPFVGVTRVMFLYHYFFSFIFSLIFAIMLWNDLSTDQHGAQLKKPTHRRVYAAVLALIAIGFMYFIPLTYGTAMSPAALQAHMWLKSWR